MLARLTILGLYEYDNTIFDGLDLPEGIDKENVINATLDKGAIFGCMYTNPLFLKRYIRGWAQRHYSMFQRWIAVLNSEYNPIRDYYIDRTRNTTGEGKKDIVENRSEDIQGNSKSEKSYDRTRNVSETEETERELKGKDVKDYDETNYNERTGEKSGSRTVNDGGNTNSNSEEKVSAFDSSSYSPRNMNTSTTNDSRETTETTGENETVNDGGGKQIDETDTTTDNESIVRGNRIREGIEDVSVNDESNKTSRTGNGTIGETRGNKEDIIEKIVATRGERSVQELIQQELELAKFEICEKIADMLVADICIMVY